MTERDSPRTELNGLLTSLAPVARLARPEARRYALALAALVAATGTAYVAPLIPKIAIDGVFSPASVDSSQLVARSVAWLGGREQLRAHPGIFAVLAVAIAALTGAFTYLQGRLTATAAEATTERLRNTLYDRLMRARLTAMGKHETGDLIQRCTADVSTVHAFVSSQLVEVGRSLLMFAVPIPLMLLVDPWMTLAAISLVPALLWVSKRFLVRLRAAFLAMDEADAAMTATIQENLAGARVVRAFAQQSREIAKLGDKNASHRDFDMEAYRQSASFWSLSDGLCVAQLALVFSLGLHRVQQGTLTAGELFYFMAVVGMYIFPLRMLGRILAEFGKTTIAAERLGVVLALEQEPRGTRALPPAHAGGARLELRGLGFRYGPEHPPALTDLDLSLQPGQVLGLFGPSGAGKSTLVDLLLGLHRPSRGELLLDGVPLAEVELAALREAIAVVPQQPILFSRSIAENIAMGHRGASREQIEAAARIACVHDSILAFPDGYETVVGERGVTLSGGQRQRVAIARALVSPARLLILDDALSAVDTATETAILSHLQRRSDTTTVVIAHRLSALMHADEILTLVDGDVVERGSHRQLLATAGLYARTWAQQNGELPPTAGHPPSEGRYG